VPAGAKEAALLARLIVSVPRHKIAAIRKRLYQAIQSMRTEFGPEDDAGPDTTCERWAVTLAFAPVTKPRRS